MIRTFLGILIFSSFSVHAENYSLVVQGLGGTPKYEEEFSRDAMAIAKATLKLSEFPENHIFLGEKQAKRETILQKFEDFVGKIKPHDSFILTLIGHGSFDGNEFKFNLPGEDLSGYELVTALERIPAQRQLLVIASSSSGAMLDLLSSNGRTVVTATRSGRESNAVSFSRHWAEAMTSNSADTNKDELLSAAEAFRFTEKRIDEYYKSEKTLATEHPRMINNNNPEFYLARTGKLAGSERNPRVSILLHKRSRLAEEFYSLKNRKAEMSEQAYLDSLQKILLQIANLQTFIDAELDSVEIADEDS